ncbi:MULTISPECIES: DUF445 domain-containing protein [Pseudoalteromonas]|uniref:DUF445 domain-containing protein n=1 Tax=Pseudoalteromonas neustonica TaxID=1840331 RepID=A0ABY3FJV3_9GAMM|nr:MULTISPECIES: DUF445 domain-containing protein [Pseudoalteromonas]MBB1291676.1 DUF445 domain-containing protein [Pseudoalteromonas sp. SR41-4]MBB1301049.1 DUF445 domain-containing protein [Pseudoalteromonas sp. SR44-8]MBB1504139.1 DUF445 domain-containing protein [Pseudoalteromonas sp. SG41-1]TVU86635.1 DUF445 domain-containing protein [Pseudoalteromonas neustonica]|tara:strand:+ start:4770 stop:5465 length:696 start_codon:yes stop_codon:yes gene_type:complete
MNKSLITNVIAGILVVAGFLFDQAIVLSIGLFALSGAVTNLLAVHMLFEKVPLLYGSGVIQLKFAGFKVAIKNLILTEFFSEQKISQLLGNKNINVDLQPVINEVDLNPAFDSLLDVIEHSQFGSMLAMFGGSTAVEPMREAFIDKMRGSLLNMSETDEFKSLVNEKLTQSGLASDSLFNTVSGLVDERLDELTPKMVKDIIQTMIREHLGWLVVWGGVFGGLFGLIAAII